MEIVRYYWISPNSPFEQSNIYKSLDTPPESRIYAMSFQPQNSFEKTLTGMCKPSQLLLAHCLERNNPDVELLSSDLDIRDLQTAQWVTSMPCPTIGVVCFKIKSEVWKNLRSFRQACLEGDLAADLAGYRKRKSISYPWNW